MLFQRNSPKPTLKPPVRKSTTLQFLFDLDSKCSTAQNGQNVDSREEELSSIIIYCTELRSHDQDSTLKKLKLTQLLSIIKTSITPISDRTLDILFKMVAANLFRPLPPPSSTACSVVVEDDDVITVPYPDWEYLQIVYDILIRLLIKIDVKTVQGENNGTSKILNQGPSTGEKFITRNFILNLLTLINSDDLRERDALKNVIHHIYSKFTFYRPFMRKSMTDVLLHFIYETDHWQNGIGEILEIWGSIINGFTVPLKEQHKVFLTRVLIPLHKPKNMTVYNGQLVYCVSQFVQKEGELGRVVIEKILRYWPMTNCQKEVLLIGELEEIVGSIDRRQYLMVAVPLWNRLAKCISSNNSQVAERALCLWNNEQFMSVVSQDIEMVLPILVEAMETNLKLHWSKTVQELTQNMKILLQELDPLIYNKWPSLD